MFSRPCHINPVYTIPLYFFRIHFNIILPSTPGLFPQSFPTKYLLTLPLLTYMLHVSPLSAYILSYRSIQTMKHFPSAPCSLVPVRPMYFPLHHILKHLSFNERDQVLHLYKTTGKVMLLCIIMCHIWYRNK